MKDRDRQHHDPLEDVQKRSVQDGASESVSEERSIFGERCQTRRPVSAPSDSSIHFECLRWRVGRLAVVDQVSLPDLPEQVRGAENDGNAEDKCAHLDSLQYVCSSAGRIERAWLALSSTLAQKFC